MSNKDNYLQSFKRLIGWVSITPQPILALPRYAKLMIAVTVDISLCIITLWLALYLRSDEFIMLTGPVFLGAVLSITIALPVFFILGLYRTIFRYSGVSAILSISRALTIYGLLYATVVMVIGVNDIPRTVGIIQPLLLFFAIGGTRAVTRYWLGGSTELQLLSLSTHKALVYGAGVAGQQLVSALKNSYETQVVGFLDDDNRLFGHILSEQSIFDPHDLGNLIESKRVTHVFLAIPSVNQKDRNKILNKLSKYNVSVRTLPSLFDLSGRKVSSSDLRELDVDDLLTRDIIAPSHILLSKNIESKVILVTGAGGSIGSELCRQIIKLKPKKLLLIDISECALYTIHSELESILADLDESANLIIPLLASVQDEDRMTEIIDTWKPSSVFHSAAYKHVPLVEHNVAEGVKNNVIGTLVIAQVSMEKGVSDFVLISTDKAVRPTNIMGASKRLSELCVQALFNKQKKNKNTKFSIVRFGNVLGSSGSVIPKFRKQILDGGPITLTHSDVMRYFMTVTESAQLVIQAGAMSKGGDVFVLDMGLPIKIIDLARSLIELSGLSVRDKNNLAGDIEIQITGLRPGEKLYEELLLGENPQPTSHPKIKKAQDPYIPWDTLKIDLDILKVLLNNANVEVISTLLQKLVTGYKPNSKIVDWVFTKQTDLHHKKIN